jgi:hypothetical protein
LGVHDFCVSRWRGCMSQGNSYSEADDPGNHEKLSRVHVVSSFKESIGSERRNSTTCRNT